MFVRIAGLVGKVDKMENICRITAERAVKEWYGYQNPVELELACRTVRDHKPKVIVEIGIAFAASLAAWKITANPDIAIGIDPFTIQGDEAKLASRDKLIKEYDLKTIEHISRLEVAHEKLKKLLDGRKIDFLFIDGNHGYDDARHDFQEYRKYLAPNALIGFHDVYYCDTLVDAGSTCCLYWQRMKRDYERYYEFYNASSMGIGIIQLDSLRKVK